MPNKTRSFAEIVSSLFSVKAPKKRRSAERRRSSSADENKGLQVRSERETAAKKDAPAKRETTSLAKPTARKKRTRKLPRSVRKKRGYWKLFYYTFGMLFIIVGSVVILLFVVQNDPSLLGLTNEYIEQAKESIAAGNEDEAVSLLEKCLDIDTTNADAIMLLADIYHGQQRYSSELSLLLDGIQSDVNSENIVFYKRIVQAYVAQNLIKEACDFCDGLSAYMTRQMADVRPENIQSPKDQGVYASAVTVSLSVPKDSTVYYTTDGSFPDVKNSLVYNPDNGGILVGKGTVTVRAVAVNADNLVSNLFEGTYRIYNDNTQYEFVDTRVEEIVRAMLNRSAGDTLYYKDLQKITDFTTDVAGLAPGSMIQSLADLVVMSSLRSVTVTSQNEIADYDVLNQIPSLVSLTVQSSALDDNALSKISSLTNITDLSLINDSLYRLPAIDTMTQLSSLDVSNNFITDVSPISSLDKLEKLNISGNRIADISVLSGLRSITQLDISDNSLLTKLTGISALTKLETLYMKGLSVTSVSELSSLKKLSKLVLDGSAVESLAPLSSCTKLIELSLNNTNATDFANLSAPMLTSLYAAECGITDISALANFTVLTKLDLRDNSVSSVAALANNKNLSELVISRNPAANLNLLLDLESLSYLECSGCPISGLVMSKFSEKGINVVY